MGQNMMMSATQPVDGKAYMAPKLTVYGAVADLTAGGASGSCENNGNNGACGPRNRNKPLQKF